MKTNVMLKLSRKFILYFFFSLLTGWGMQAQTCNTIVGGTNFEAITPDTGDFRNINSITHLGPSGGIIETPLSYAEFNSDFGTKAVYGVVDNPKDVNSSYLDIDEPMMIITGVNGGQELLTYDVSGLKAGSAFEITIEGYLLNSDSSECSATTQFLNPFLAFSVGSALWGVTYYLESAKWQKKFTYTGTVTLSSISKGFSLQIGTGWNYAHCLAIGISKIEIKGCLSPKIKSNQGLEVCKDEQVRLELDREYYGIAYKWEKSPDGISGWVTVGGNTKAILDEVNSNTCYRCTITLPESIVVSEVFRVNTIYCCEVSPGIAASRKVIYYDNFGTFSNATKYMDAWGNQSTVQNWRTCLPGGIMGHNCEVNGPVTDGNYVVATLGPGVLPDWLRGGMTEDALGDTNGGVLFINVSTGYTGEIYKRQIDNLCPNVTLYAEVYVANASCMNNTIPPNVTISILKTDGVSVLGAANSALTISTTGWQRVTMPPFSTNETSVILRIVSNNTSGWAEGVDLLMDEVILRVCSPPSVEIYSDLSSLKQDTTICDKDNITLETTPSLLLHTYYGSNPRYLYQVSTNGITWSNISGKLSTPSFTHAMGSYAPDSKVYFRMIAAIDVELDKFILNPNEEGSTLCKTVSISDPITITVISCPTSNCTDPQALNYDPQATDDPNNSCDYADKENTHDEPVTETPADTVGTKALVSCDLTVGKYIVSAVISKIDFITGYKIIAHWVIKQEDGETYNFSAEYTIQGPGITLFYLSIICKPDDLLKSGSGETGYTVSAVFDVPEPIFTGFDQPASETNKVVVYPNPFVEKLNVLVKGAKVADVALYSIEGNLLATYRNLNEVQISTNNLPAGVYVVKVTVDGKIETVTVVKK